MQRVASSQVDSGGLRTGHHPSHTKIDRNGVAFQRLQPATDPGRPAGWLTDQYLAPPDRGSRRRFSLLLLILQAGITPRPPAGPPASVVLHVWTHYYSLTCARRKASASTSTSSLASSPSSPSRIIRCGGGGGGCCCCCTIALPVPLMWKYVCTVYGSESNNSGSSIRNAAGKSFSSVAFSMFRSIAIIIRPPRSRGRNSHARAPSLRKQGRCSVRRCCCSLLTMMEERPECSRGNTGHTGQRRG